MEPQFLSYLTTYGYLAIFVSVFLPEVGIPVPFPVEFLLLFAGYLSWIGTLSFWPTLIVAVGADLIGTTIFYLIFYFFGHMLVAHKPRWLPFNTARITGLAERIASRGRAKIYFGRLIPFLRGYVSAGAGILQVPPNVFLPLAFLSALTWSGGYVILGRLLGPRLEETVALFGGIYNLIAAVAAFVVVVAIAVHLLRRHHKEIPDHHKP